MKTYQGLLFIVLGATLSIPALAGNNRCGLGSKLWGKNKGIVSQVSEMITNPTSSEGSSVSTGTSGCKHNGVLFFEPLGKNDRLNDQLLYANANYEELLLEMAAGSGGTLQGFAETFGCSGDAAGVFGTMTKAGYSRIINHDEVTPEQMLYNVRETFRTTAPLVKSCGAA